MTWLGRLFPYFIIMKLVAAGKLFHAQYGKLKVNEKVEYDVTFYQIHQGEFIVFSKELQDIFDAREKKKYDKKFKKSVIKIDKELRKNYKLKQYYQERFQD